MNNILLKKFNRVEKRHWWWEGRRQLIIKFIPKEKHLKVLDVGCGTGETLSFIKKERPTSILYGIDEQPLAVSYTKSRDHTKVRVAEALKLPFKNNYFDVLLYLDVLEHIKDHKKALIEGKRVLKKGGVMIITVPSLPFIMSDFDHNQGHYRRYRTDDFYKLEKSTGLKLVFINYFNIIFAIPIILIRLIGRYKLFAFMSNYDRGFNYEIAFNQNINKFLKLLFLFEISYIKKIKYPIGISLVSVFEKN